jgi:hypothetical protein
MKNLIVAALAVSKQSAESSVITSTESVTDIEALEVEIGALT